MPADVLELRQIDQAKKRARLYRMTECKDLFGEICLFIEWGRIGRRLRSRLEPFPDIAAREARKRELVERRRRHGYLK
jgi:predicted DNA-binding WGR domain protein